MKYFGILVLFLLVSGCASNRADQPDSEQTRSFSDESVGFAMDIPRGWAIASRQTVEENRARIRLDDSELEAALKNRASAPLLAVMKFPDPHPTLNPAIQVILRPLDDFQGMPPTKILAVVTQQMRTMLSDLEFLQGPIAVEVSGLDAAHLRANYVLKTSDGGAFPVTARTWIVPRGTMMFVIGMSGPQEGPDLSEAEFQAAFESILIATD
jgi:hypothetical protein